MSTYQWVLYLHISCAIFSISFFSLRAYWMLSGNALLEHRISRTLPHIIDSILLLAAISLTFFIQQFPVQNDWLSIKVLALLVYIVLGSVAIKRGKTMKQRVIALLFAWLTFAFIASVAYYHHPLGFLLLL